MDDQMMDLMDPGDRLVGRLLQVYGEEALTPSIGATTRMRMAVMGPAHRRAALLEADAALRVATAAASTLAQADKQARSAAWAWRRPAAAVMAVGLTLGMFAGSTFAATAGGPLYEARIWAEMVNLPTGGVERAQAEATRLTQRIQEAVLRASGISVIGVTPGSPAGPEACAVPIRSTTLSSASRMSVASRAFATLPRPLLRHSPNRVSAAEFANQFACEPSAT